MKILLLGDASNCHFALSQGLARLGHDVAVASHGSKWMGTGRDIDISRSPGKLGGLWLWIKLNTLLARDLRGYDVVQLCGPMFVQQKPERVRALFDQVRRHNGSVFVTALGTDSPYVDMCLDPASPLRYNEWRAYGQPTPYAKAHPDILAAWRGEPLTGHCRYVYDHADGAVAVLYEYYLSLQRILPPEKAAYAGIPIDINLSKYQNDKISNCQNAGGSALRVMLACHQGREAEKGADVMLPLLEGFARENGSKVQFDFVQNRPFAEFSRLLSEADVVVDQLYSYTPATTALMAMADGKVVISGGEPEYYDFIGERHLRPIINIDPGRPEQAIAALQTLVDDRQRLAEMGRDSREFAIKHNSAEAVARRFVDFWERRLG
ncbi:MAG: hypothetical protein K2N16_00035 [Muribaculaceae bacterium]|nr:hypothetical protein [Muribaculaceae bacterium]